ncbi:NADH-quinone oxidoreductase subunit K [Isoalcanivorax indicus]|uniref:NADH-quinone oxidoreductase subunit K n=1 Tax=Isoalcanivorax indicus TaxID=2202653 RepID=UPI000DBA13EB|nr:NADH-quinone oxidoreductase subunit K [Isoalcanivorax indicus]
MTEADVWIIAGAGLVLIGLAGFLFARHLLRRLLAFNITGSGALLMVLALSGDERGLAPALLVLTGMLVALGATALGLYLLRLWQQQSGRTDLPPPPDLESDP